jgi:hypothetical protein
MTGSVGGELRSLSAELVELYRYLLIAHANDRLLGICLLCLEACCLEWRVAFERLTSTGELSDYKPLDQAPGVYVRSQP